MLNISRALFRLAAWNKESHYAYNFMWEREISVQVTITSKLRSSHYSVSDKMTQRLKVLDVKIYKYSRDILSLSWSLGRPLKIRNIFWNSSQFPFLSHFSLPFPLLHLFSPSLIIPSYRIVIEWTHYGRNIKTNCWKPTQRERENPHENLIKM